MKRALFFFQLMWLSLCYADSEIKLTVEQLTSGPKHHFFGYIGQSLTIPWNGSGRYILAMEVEQTGNMPEPEEAATVVIIDTHNDNAILPLDRTHAWNPQQGTMFYWNPKALESQFFFNDRDVETGNVFTVLYDIEKRKRIREYRFEEGPIGNGRVSPDGTHWLGINYGRLARLRSVTGYPDALDWSANEVAPERDGIFKVNVESGEKQLLVSYRQIADILREERGITPPPIGLHGNHIDVFSERLHHPGVKSS